MNSSCNFAIKSSKAKYFGIVGGALRAEFEDSSDPSSEFTIEWHGAKIALKANNGKYVSQMPNKYLHANSAERAENCMFTYQLVNRPKLVLRGEYGFVGTLPSGLLECNKSSATAYDATLNNGNLGISSNNKFWKVHSNGVSVNSDAAEDYHIEIYDDSKLAVKHEGKYFQSNQNGAFSLTGTKIDKYTLFEY